MEPAHLDDRAIVAISGPEGRDFLQRIITNDVGALVPGAGLYAALLSPQGKIAFDFFLTEGDGALLIDCARQSAELLLKRLRMYRLRARIEIELRPQLAVYSTLAGHPANRPSPFADRAVTFWDPRSQSLGKRSIGALAEMPSNFLPSQTYHHTRLCLGIPEASDFGFERVFALEAGLEELNAISFAKGCYIGQELTSRMKHRRSARKRIWMIEADTFLPSTGTLKQGTVEIGEILASYGPQAFVLVRLERIQERMGPFFVGESRVRLHKPSWLA